MDRKQPVVIGTNEKGELIWGFIPMARWQMAMFPLTYYGDFMAFWIRRHFYDLTGYESEHDAPSMELRRKKWKSKPPTHNGD